MNLPVLSLGEFDLVYNMLSLAIAAMFGSFVFVIMSKSLTSIGQRDHVVLVVGIAGYHYWRIFNSWDAAYALDAAKVSTTIGVPFNDAYRYVDWLLTVPLLVAELVAVLALIVKSVPMMTKLIIASVLMIAFGYPGEIAPTTWFVAQGRVAPYRSVIFCTFSGSSSRARDSITTC